MVSKGIRGGGVEVGVRGRECIYLSHLPPRVELYCAVQRGM